MKKKAKYIFGGMFSILLVFLMAFYLSPRKEQHEQKIESEAPNIDYWKIFSGISLQRKFIDEADAYYRIPIFTSDLLALAGKEVTLNGYYLPYSKLDSVIIISRFPNAGCFFCGQAGIESVAMVELGRKSDNLYRMDQLIAVTGKLKLNANNINKLAFVITDASVKEL